MSKKTASNGKSIKSNELERLAIMHLKKPGPRCQICQLHSSVRNAIDVCLRDGISRLGLSRALADKGYAVTGSQLKNHRHHIPA